MKLYLTKTQIGLVTADEIAAEALDKYRNGTVLLCEIVQPRNYKFHKKFFALLNLGFQYWKPAEVDSKFGAPEKNFDTFREQVVIMAGFYHMVVTLRGEARAKADSISFANMSEDKFQDLYNKVLNVLLKIIFIGYTDEQVIKMAEEQILSFS